MGTEFSGWAVQQKVTLLREICEPLIAAGTPPAAIREAVRRELGIGIGIGGGGNQGGDPCPVCEAVGGGGHGGFCPLGQV